MPHFYFSTAASSRFSPFEVPVEVVQNGLCWMLANPLFKPLETVLSREFFSVEALRDELECSALAPHAIDQVQSEIDRLVDEYRSGVIFL